VLRWICAAVAYRLRSAAEGRQVGSERVALERENLAYLLGTPALLALLNMALAVRVLARRVHRVRYMSVEFVRRAPREIYRRSEAHVGPSVGPAEARQIAEIFQTPLTGAYSWSYEDSDRKIRRLYELGKKLNWNASHDLDWSKTFPRTESPVADGFNPFEGWAPFEALSEAERIEFAWHQHAWMLSQFLHGEQGALLVASQLVSCAPTQDAKLYAASQTFDEARHVEVFGRYLLDKIGFMYPINDNLKTLLDKILTDARWDLKFIGMQLVIESLALAAFHTQRMLARDHLLLDVIDLVIRDESRHVAFGVTYMEQFVKSLTPQEIEERAQFAYDACVVMRERILGTEVLAHFGMDVEEGRTRMLDAVVMREFRKLLFSRIIPNLAKVGLITERVRPLYDELGVLEYENLVHDGVIDWAKLESESDS